MACVLVTGGTGALGQRLVPRLRAAGYDVRLSVPAGGAGPGLVAGDLATGAGVEVAVDGVTTIVHGASARKGDPTATAILVRAASRAGTSHLLLPSIVGVERVAFGYAKTNWSANGSSPARASPGRSCARRSSTR
ncbi:MAG TPA: NAD(P)H-binding protein [Asanoa sp.]